MSNDLLWKMLEGKIINNQYHLKKLLGSGGFGGVFLADEVVRDRLIRNLAIKLMILDNSGRQLEELIAATTLKHPNLLDSYSCGECQVNGNLFLFLLMELAQSNLEIYLQNQTCLSESQTLKLAQNLVEALAFLHSQPNPRVHRDVKPENILSVSNTWKLGDFGLVRAMSCKTSKTTNIMGTSGYVPPESYDGIVSPAWDMWSVGVIICQALTGKLPFKGDTPQQQFQQVLNAEPDLSKLSPYFRKIAQGCLEKKRSQRWSAIQVLEYCQKINNFHEAELYSHKAFTDQKNKDHHSALENYNKAINLNPHHLDAYRGRAITHFILGYYGKAVEDYTKAIDLKPNNPDFYWERAFVRCYLKDYFKAIEDYSKAIELNPNNAVYYTNRANAYIAITKDKKAQEDFEQASKLNKF